MTTLEIKNNFHSRIDSIDNEQLLLNFYELIKSRTSTRDGYLWSQLTKEEQDELYLALSESDDEYNIISHQEMKVKHKKWL